MNFHQNLWWEQARSDHEILIILRRADAAPCHQLHYLQMVTEKLSKAYFWRAGIPPPRTHTGLVQLIRAWGGVPRDERRRVAHALGFKKFEALKGWIRGVGPLAYKLERLAPSLSQDGPNPEYPWPHHAPSHVPASFQFPVWSEITATAIGRQLINVLRDAIDNFPAYA